MVHALRAPWCRLEICEVIVFHWFYACTAGPVVHALLAPWCMHCGPSDSCTVGPVVHALVHALLAPWCMRRCARIALLS